MLSNLFLSLTLFLLFGVMFLGPVVRGHLLFLFPWGAYKEQKCDQGYQGKLESHHYVTLYAIKSHESHYF